VVDLRYLYALASFRKPTHRECDKSIPQRRAPISFGISNPRFILTHASHRNPWIWIRYTIKPPILIYHMSLPEWLNIRSSFPLSRYWFSSRKSHPESVLPCQHCMMKLIDIESSSQKDANDKIHHVSPILDLPTKKATWWDVLALRYIRFEAFKELINSKYRISY